MAMNNEQSMQAFLVSFRKQLSSMDTQGQYFSSQEEKVQDVKQAFPVGARCRLDGNKAATVTGHGADSVQVLPDGGTVRDIAIDPSVSIHHYSDSALRPIQVVEPEEYPSFKK